jgi:hypothetical protein
LGTSISSRATVAKVNRIILDRGSSFIGFLWRVRRAVWPWDSSEHPCFHLLGLGSACSVDGNISFGLVFLYFPMLVCWPILCLCWRVLTACFSTLHYCPLIASALLAGSSIGRLRGYFSSCEFSLVCDQYLYCSG